MKTHLEVALMLKMDKRNFLRLSASAHASAFLFTSHSAPASSRSQLSLLSFDGSSSSLLLSIVFLRLLRFDFIFCLFEAFDGVVWCLAFDGLLSLSFFASMTASLNHCAMKKLPANCECGSGYDNNRVKELQDKIGMKRRGYEPTMRDRAVNLHSSNPGGIFEGLESYRI